MISLENQVIDAIDRELATAYPSAVVTAGYVRSSSQFPCVQVVEIDTRVLERASTLSTIEVMATVVIEINFFSNKTSSKKEECKELAAITDDVMENLGFMRTMLSQTPNYEDSTIFRMTGRWQKIQPK
jgi:hypothetical protein